MLTRFLWHLLNLDSNNWRCIRVTAMRLRKLLLLAASLILALPIYAVTAARPRPASGISQCSAFLRRQADARDQAIASW